MGKGLGNGEKENDRSRPWHDKGGEWDSVLSSSYSRTFLDFILYSDCI